MSPRSEFDKKLEDSDLLWAIFIGGFVVGWIYIIGHWLGAWP